VAVTAVTQCAAHQTARAPRTSLVSTPSAVSLARAQRQGVECSPPPAITLWQPSLTSSPRTHLQRTRIPRILVDAVATPEAPRPGQCFQQSTCQYNVTVPGGVVAFDVSPLCKELSEYSVSDGQGHTYQFNGSCGAGKARYAWVLPFIMMALCGLWLLAVCGNTKSQCMPKEWLVQSTVGVVAQFFGATPPCNQTAPECTDFYGNPACCTPDCDLLGAPVAVLGAPSLHHPSKACSCASDACVLVLVRVPWVSQAWGSRRSHWSTLATRCRVVFSSLKWARHLCTCDLCVRYCVSVSSKLASALE
jgi:hypothetical protein